MSDPVATVVRFDGDPDDLLRRFERARGSWVDAHKDEEPPFFYAACKSEAGIAIILAWRGDAEHEAFGKRMAVHLRAAGLSRPNSREILRIAKLGWPKASATAS